MFNNSSIENVHKHYILNDDIAQKLSKEDPIKNYCDVNDAYFLKKRRKKKMTDLLKLFFKKLRNPRK